MDLAFMSFSMMREAFGKKMDADKLCTIAKSNDIRYLDLLDIEVRLYGEKKLKAAMHSSGVECGCIITTPPFYSAPKQVRNKLKTAFKLAADLGADTLMVVPGSTGMDNRACAKLSRYEMLDRAAQHYALAVELGRQYGIRVGFENTPADYKPLASAEDCRWLLDKVPGLGMIFDTGNFRVAGTDSDELAAYELLKDRIIRVHVKDVVVGRFDSGEACVDGQKIRAVTTGSGVIPVEALLGHLHDDGYNGVLAVEYAAKPGIQGEEHSKWVRPYVSFIRAAWEKRVIRPPYAQVQGVDKPVSRIFFGTAIRPMLMGGNVEALLDAVLSSGINAFDCARGYGMAEKSLGQWLRSRNNRERVVLLTKCGNISLSGKVRVNRKVIETELEKSLVTLGSDYIDIYLLHRDDPKTPVSEIVETLNEAKRRGKVRVFGVSNWTHQRIEEANRYAAEHGLEGFGVSSPNFGLTRQMQDPWGGDCVTVSGPENESARKWYVENRMPVIAYSSLGRGFFSGKFRSGDYEGAKKALDGPAQKGYLYEENMKRLRNAEVLAERDKCSVAQVAMRYVFSHPMNTFAIASTTNPGRLPQNIQAALTPFSAEDVKFLENDA